MLFVYLKKIQLTKSNFFSIIRMFLLRLKMKKISGNGSLQNKLPIRSIIINSLLVIAFNFINSTFPNKCTHM